MPVIEELSWVRVVLAVAIHVVISAVAAWDLAAVASGHGNFTVSSLIQKWAIEAPSLPLAVGFVIGHLFWPVR